MYSVRLTKSSAIVIRRLARAERGDTEKISHNHASTPRESKRTPHVILAGELGAQSIPHARLQLCHAKHACCGTDENVSIFRPFTNKTWFSSDIVSTDSHTTCVPEVCFGTL